MRWEVLVLLLVFLFSFAGVVSAVGEDSLVAYWKMEGNLDDSVGEYNDGAMEYSDGVWEDGSADYFIFELGGDRDLGKAANFDGSEKIVVNSFGLNFFHGFTVEMMVKSSTSLSATLFEDGQYKIEWVLEMSPAPSWHIRASASNDDGDYSIQSGALSRDTPYHVALVWDTSKLVLYVNGESVGDDDMLRSVSTAGALEIGSGFKGLIDEVAVFDEGLSANTIRLHSDLAMAGKDYFDASGAGGSSSTRTDFNILGCSFPLGGIMVGLGKGKCSADGRYFCTENSDLLDTSVAGLGCSRGVFPYVVGTLPCCPDPKITVCADVDGSNEYKCELGDTCSADLSEDDCEDNLVQGTFYDPNPDEDGDEVCLCGDELCNTYANSDDCGADANRFVENHVEWKNVCGTTVKCGDDVYSVPKENCTCAWSGDVDTGSCGISTVYVQMFHLASELPDIVECNKGAYEFEECVEGNQEYNWTVNFTDLSDPPLSDENRTALKACLGCNSGEDSRACGRAIIKVPGFSLFAFFSSLFVLGMYYLNALRSV